MLNAAVYFQGEGVRGWWSEKDGGGGGGLFSSNVD